MTRFNFGAPSLSISLAPTKASEAAHRPLQRSIYGGDQR
jgi:hypothetical protein